MPTRLDSVVIDAEETPDEVVVEPRRATSGAPTEPGLPLVFGRVDDEVDDEKVGKNRVHPDFNSTSADHQAELVERVRRAGATPLDIGQGPVPWVVLADPEGNELCMLSARDDRVHCVEPPFGANLTACQKVPPPPQCP